MVDAKESKPSGMTSPRVKILEEAALTTGKFRNEQYGDPVRQGGLAGLLKMVVRQHTCRAMSPAEGEACDMLLTKISRAVVGGAPGLDTFLDMAAYAAIWGEAYQHTIAARAQAEANALEKDNDAG